MHACRCAPLQVCVCSWLCLYISWLPTCLTTGVVSFDCIDSVPPPHAVMKDEKWTARSEHEVIGLHLVSHGPREAEAAGGGGGRLRLTAVCMPVWEVVLGDDQLLRIHTVSVTLFICDVGGKNSSQSIKPIEICSDRSCSRSVSSCRSYNVPTEFPAPVIQTVYPQLSVCWIQLN